MRKVRKIMSRASARQDEVIARRGQEEWQDSFSSVILDRGYSNRPAMQEELRALYRLI
jgi:hypothetical protein